MAYSDASPVSSSPADVTACDREPIRTPGSIQPHGFLFALHPSDMTVLQVSGNATDKLGLPVTAVLGQRLDDVLGAANLGPLPGLLRRFADTAQPRPLCVLRLPALHAQPLQVLAHRCNGMLMVEMEQNPEQDNALFIGLYDLVHQFMTNIYAADTVQEMSQLCTQEVRSITGFDHVMVYQFDQDWHGTVIGEDRNERLPAYLDLRFPASDIPAQARELYRKNRLRIIPNADYRPVSVYPSAQADGSPLDMSSCVLRSISPVHVEYMKNMGTLASMSISIIKDDQLWGLIACHHAAPRHVPYEVRKACDLIAQAFGMQLSAKLQGQELSRRLQLKSGESALLSYMAQEEEFIHGLINNPSQLMDFAAAQGVAVLYAGECRRYGQAPSEQQVRRIADFLFARSENGVFSSSEMVRELPEAAEYSAKASGVLACPISMFYPSYIVWFRPEIIQTVAWAGNPEKPVEGMQGAARLHPRTSFDAWKETVRGQSVPWLTSEIEATADLSTAILSVVLRKAEELAQLMDLQRDNQDLERNNHDLERSNKELEAFSYSVSHDLRAPFRHVIGYAELLLEMDGDKVSETGRRFIRTIIDSAHFAGTLVDNLLNFSRIGRSALYPVLVDTNQLVADVIASLALDMQNRKIDWKIQPLQPCTGDLMLLRLAFQNLLANAIKYTRTRVEAVIEIGCCAENNEIVYYVSDNGVGFDMEYADKLFGVFQRLHRMEDFEGTGIGLANVRRLVSRHGGRTWAKGTVDQGATFYFSLPNRDGDTAK